MSKGGDPGDLRRSVRRGEFQVTRPQDWVFEGNIRHRVCRSTLPTPSGWADRAVAVCEHSGQKPDVWMQLEHVFGYNGPKNIQPNVFYTKPRPDGQSEVLYYTSAVGVLYDPPNNSQRSY